MTDPALKQRLSDRDGMLLVGLADGTFSGRRRAQAEARAAQIPDAARLIARQRRVARALAATPVRVAPPRAVPARRAPRLPRLRLATAGMLAAAAIAGLVALFALRGDRPTVAQAASLAGQPATQSAPPSSGRALQASVDGVSFPDWSAAFGWHETGTRRDTVNGRATRTVFYEHMGHRIAYTIVSGRPLPVPAGARVVRRDGMEIAVYHDPDHGGHDVAVFRRGGRTCVLAGHVMRQSTLIELAAWTSS
jgi:hypothetical protein